MFVSMLSSDIQRKIQEIPTPFIESVEMKEKERNKNIENILINITDPIESYLAGWWIVLLLLISGVAFIQGDD